MTRKVLVLSLATVAIGQVGAFAFCPTGKPNELLCEDFDTYCTAGQYPGGAGVLMGTVCPAATAVPADGNANLQAVWAQTSITEAPIPPLCGTAAALDHTLTTTAVPTLMPSSLPFSSRHLAISDGNGAGSPLAQHTFKDWQTGELNFSRFTANSFGDKFKAVRATDETPVVLTFDMTSADTGSIFYNAGYMELGFGSSSDPINRANTDHILATNCKIACNSTVKAFVYPVVCAFGNPSIYDGGTGHEACPNPATNPPPIHNAIAVGAFPFIDVTPCHCDGYHGPTNSNLAFYDGQVWWALSEKGPYPSTGTVTPIDGACMPEVSDGEAGNFTFWGWGGETGIAHNTVTLTIKKDSVIVQHSAIFIAKPTTACPGNKWKITSEMEIPLKYKGPFNSLRTGVGAGCKLASNTSWTSCSTPRSCLTNVAPRARFVDYDNISLAGGLGWTAEGACCLPPKGACQDDTLPIACAEQGGIFKNSSSICANVTCCPTPYADADTDGDVDVSDFGILQACITGNSNVVGQCSCFDRNGDSKVDHRDLESFIVCATGPEINPDSVPAECKP